jgi:light-regulated signal transduction histidine kinase (bacteriophytochrome)
LREPLRTVSMFAQLLIKGSQLDTEGKLLAKFIIDGAARMSALFEGLQAFAIRGLDDLPQPSDLGHVVAEVLQDLAHAISNSDVIVTVDPLPCVRGSEKHLRRVFQNLIVNAIKYRSSAPIEIHVSAEPLAEGWLIKVKDNGIGIAPEHRDDVFFLLKRLHGTEIPGAGIGLSICRKIIEALGGRIWVESELGAGSTFCFTLTAANEDEIVPEPPVEDRYVDRALGEDVERASNLGMPERPGLRRACAH